MELIKDSRRIFIKDGFRKNERKQTINMVINRTVQLSQPYMFKSDLKPVAKNNEKHATTIRLNLLRQYLSQ